MGTQIVAVRSLLVDGVSALPTLDGVEVNLGYRVNSKKRERVWTQNAKFDHQPASMRAVKTFRDENGSFEVVVLIEGIGKDAEWTAGRAVEIGLEIEEWVAVHANWQGAIDGLSAVKVQGAGSLTEAFNDKGTLAELVYTITYQARLT